MDYYCDLCDNYNKPNSKYKHFKSSSQKDFDKCKHILLSLKKNSINDVYEAFSLYIIEHNKKFDYYLVKCQFKLVFIEYQYCSYVTSKLSDNKTIISWSKFSKKTISDSEDKGYTFNQIAEMHIITIANKMDTSYDFYRKHNMCALEWKLNGMINKNRKLINEFDGNWRHPLNGKFESYRFQNI